MAVIEVRTRGTILKVHDGLLSIGAHTVHPDDIDLLIAEVPAVSLTGEALLMLAREGIEVTVCDHRHVPISSLVPVIGHGTLTGGTMRKQASLAPRRRDALWRQIVQAKIQNQADLVEELGRPANRLRVLVREVVAGDPENREAQAARVYWPLLFGASFRRHGDDDTNAMLDFGYAVLRAGTTRAIHAAGLLRAIGIHHDNMENDGALADDILEPFRPVVDRIVATHLPPNRVMDRDARIRLAGALDWPVLSGTEWVRTRTAMARLVRSFRKTVEGAPARLDMPKKLGTANDARGLEENVDPRVL